jgi:hypothetical protein
MEGKIAKAMQRRAERQSAVLGKEFDDSKNGVVTEDADTVRLMLSGLDIDRMEMLEASMAAVESALGAIEDGVPPIYVLKGLWVDGLLTGLLIEEES